MPALTEKQRAFAVNKAAGVKNKEAALAAGYSANGAEVAASKLMKNPAIKAAIKTAKREMAKGVVQEGVSIDTDGIKDESKYKMPKASYSDSMEFLKDAMNHQHLPIAARADYAKALLPYQHGRIGEKGKKEQANERAKVAAGGQTGGRGRYTPKSAPGSARLN